MAFGDSCDATDGDTASDAGEVGRTYCGSAAEPPRNSERERGVGRGS